MKKIKTGDSVIVIAGKFKGKTSTIESVKGDMVVVKGVNVMKKAVKGQGFVDKIHPIHISNVALAEGKKAAPAKKPAAEKAEKAEKKPAVKKAAAKKTAK